MRFNLARDRRKMKKIYSKRKPNNKSRDRDGRLKHNNTRRELERKDRNRTTHKRYTNYSDNRNSYGATIKHGKPANKRHRKEVRRNKKYPTNSHTKNGHERIASADKLQKLDEQLELYKNNAAGMPIKNKEEKLDQALDDYKAKNIHYEKDEKSVDNIK